MNINDPFDFRLRMFLIEQGDSQLAEDWLTQLIEAIRKGEKIPHQHALSLWYALRGILKSGEAAAFWNGGKKPHARLNLPQELNTWKAVDREMQKGASRSEAIVTAATKLGLVNDNSTDSEEDQAIQQVKNQYEYCQRKFKKFRQERDRAFKEIESLMTVVNKAITNPR